VDRRGESTTNVAIAEFAVALGKNALAQIELTRAKEGGCEWFGEPQGNSQVKGQTRAKRSPVTGRPPKLPKKVKQTLQVAFNQ